MDVKERIEALRNEMAQEGMDIYLVPTADFHESEYAGEHFAVRKFLSGFTGSAGTLVVTQTEAGLWTDGRYYLQAERQLAGSGITLYRMGEEGVPTVEEFIVEKLPEGGRLGFDGRVINSRMGENLEQKLARKQAEISYGKDLADVLWTDRPGLSAEPAFFLKEQYSGKSSREKLSDLRQELAGESADYLILTSLDDIAWLFNIRGHDIPYNPVVLAYAVIAAGDAEETEGGYLFLEESVLDETIRQELAENRIQVRPYDSIYHYVKELPEKSRVWLCKARVNYAIYRNLPKETTIIDQPNPTTLAKAVKNPVEVENLRRSHIKDGVAVTKFMYWLKKNVGKVSITEISAADYLEGLRREQEGFIEPSFHTISAYNANAAMMHYSASDESNAELKPEGLLLVDSGGQYYEGTTDITRTFVLGPIPAEWKKHYTLVAKGMLNLANAKFLYGCKGRTLDILCRAPLWNLGIDYRCGTGHGVGYLLNVHEGPNGFRWKRVPEREDGAILEEGMVTTDEPGVYIENSHGIRIENELVCQKAEKNEYGQFMQFEVITCAPIDLEGIDTTYLSPEDIRQLNDYHKKVYEKISPYLEPEEAEWLKEQTREL